MDDLFPRRQSEDVQVYLHHPSAPARVKYPAPWGELAREKLSHAPLLRCGVFDSHVYNKLQILSQHFLGGDTYGKCIWICACV